MISSSFVNGKMIKIKTATNFDTSATYNPNNETEKRGSLRERSKIYYSRRGNISIIELQGLFDGSSGTKIVATYLRLIVAITGASGVIYGKRLLEVLGESKVEIYLIVSKAAESVIRHELGTTKKQLEKLAKHVYDVNDLSASLASGSFKTEGMIVIPCSMKTLAGIAHGYSDNLILRAADVALKEKRKLILVPRETPLSVVHLRNMLNLASQGVHILPAMPAFYHKPEKMEDLIDFVVGKALDLLGMEHELFKRWSS